MGVLAPPSLWTEPQWIFMHEADCLFIDADVLVDSNYVNGWPVFKTKFSFELIWRNHFSVLFASSTVWNVEITKRGWACFDSSDWLEAVIDSWKHMLQLPPHTDMRRIKCLCFSLSVLNHGGTRVIITFKPLIKKTNSRSICSIKLRANSSELCSREVQWNVWLVNDGEVIVVHLPNFNLLFIIF